MCGITGIFNRNGAPVSPVILRRMADAIAHRGPDSEGFYTESFIGFGHRRLAIIDLSAAGHQPMQTRDGQYVLTYNGEVYNYQELRIVLEAEGWQFHSRTDTEVVLAAYAVWGPECVQRFNGMFAFAIWDHSRQSLFLARDRYGIKPLYYTQQGPVFVFGSEIKALRACPQCPTGLNKLGLLEYFTFQNFFTDATLFEGVRLLPAGTTLTVTLGNDLLPTPSRYWDFSFEEPEPVNPMEAEEELGRLFVQAVNRQLVSDVPVGSYLSGGMDSGSIVAVAAKQIPNLHTFTIGFDLHSASGMELAYDERGSAEYLSYINQTEHYEMVLKAGDMERAMDRITGHLEEPRVGQSYPNFYAAQLASKFVKVVLSGAGGDELFAGYPWRYYRAVHKQSGDEYIERYFGFWQRLIPQHQLAEVFEPIWKDVSDFSPRDVFRNIFTHPAQSFQRPEDCMQQSLYFEAKTFLHGLLVVEDKLSMAHSLEARVPFLDNDLVDFAMRLPIGLKLNQLGEVLKRDENDLAKFISKTSDGKQILRNVMRSYVPDTITSGVKQGFSAPDASWFKGESIEYVRRTLLNPRSPIYEFMSYPSIRDMVQEHLDGRVNHRLLIWSLLTFESWMRTFT